MQGNGRIKHALDSGHGDALPPILYVDDLASFLGRTPKAIRTAVARGRLPRPLRLAGRLAWRGQDVLDFVSETHAASQTSAKSVNITAERYHYDHNRFRVTFELPKLPGQPRQRVRKVAPAGLDFEQALAWGKRIERDVLREMLQGNEREEKARAVLLPRNYRPAPAKIASRAGSRKVQTLAEFWAERFEPEYLSTCKPATRKNYVSIWTNYIRPTIGDVPLDMVDRDALAKLRGALGRLKPVSRNTVLGKLRMALEMAARWYLLPEAPVVKRERQPKEAEPAVYTEEEATRLVAAAKNDGRDALAMVLLMLHGGLRVSEVCALRWTDVDFSARRMTIAHNFSAGHESTPKGGKPAPVGLSPELSAALAALPRRGIHVLVRTYRGEQCPHTPHSITHRLQVLQQAARLEPSGPHRLRHTCITIMARGGFPTSMLQKHARHARLSTTERYIHLVEDEVSVEAAEFWARRSHAGAVAQTRPKRPKRRQVAATAPT